MPGVHGIQHSGAGAAFSVDTKEINGVLAHLTGFGIIKLECSPPTLEELFMSHYEKTGGQ
jgi:ABC-2 type transport system ATP-binding protein